jgi:exopolyphosphatase/guanosine-5'-triphosphate,3'-diphosphate pyrophosphatase
MKKKVGRLLAVVELGTTSVRMVVGQAARGNHVDVVDELEHSISLGHDTMASQAISQETTERCVGTLRRFRQVLDEYGVKVSNVRVVATSAVREASNRDRFVDRVLIATGFEVEVLDQAEVSRLTYRAVFPQLQGQSFFRKSDTMVVEVGGGSMETLLFRKGKVSSAHLYKLGALRLRAVLDDPAVPRERVDSLMRAEIDQSLVHIQENVRDSMALRIVLLGADARNACLHLHPDWDRTGLCRLSVAELTALWRDVLDQRVDNTAKTYGLTYIEAETLGPALNVYVELARQYRLKHVLVGGVTLRDGLMMEMLTGERWTNEFRRQVISSAKDLARKYGVDLRHGRYVASYGLQLINQLQEKYEVSERDQVIYEVAALLHDAGQLVSPSSHHKHSRYLIQNSNLFGLSQHDIVLVSLVARYHRGAVPKPSHSDYTSLTREDRIRVSKLAAVIRVANALDRVRGSRQLKLRTHMEEGRLILEIKGAVDMTLIKERVHAQADLFASVFGKELQLRERKG